MTPLPARPDSHDTRPLRPVKRDRWDGRDRERREPGSPIRRRLERAGYRLVPLNRASPTTGPWYTDCPRCGAFGGLHVEAGEHGWTSTCHCFRGQGDVFDLFAFLVGAR